ncbi:2-enoate reductase, partial [Staphylococcus aureus]|nr:2-enoate reductase [Staphylococcus aureus]
YASELKEALPDIPLIVAGRMDDPDLAANAVSDGIVDMVSLARPTLADPDIVVKLQTDHAERVRPCISCQEGCL